MILWQESVSSGSFLPWALKSLNEAVLFSCALHCCKSAIPICTLNQRCQGQATTICNTVSLDELAGVSLRVCHSFFCCSSCRLRTTLNSLPIQGFELRVFCPTCLSLRSVCSCIQPNLLPALIAIRKFLHRSRLF